MAASVHRGAAWNSGLSRSAKASRADGSVMPMSMTASS